MATTVQAMESERWAKVAAERAKIETADKVKAAKANKEAKAERERIAKATAEQKAKEAAKPPAPKKKGAVEHQRGTAVKKVIAGMDNPTPSGVVKAVRASGVSAAGKRIRAAFDQATKAAKTKAGTKAKGAAAKVPKQEEAYGINR